MAEHSVMKVHLLTKKEVAKLLRCSEKTITRYVKSGYIRCERIGKRNLFNPDHIPALKTA